MTKSNTDMKTLKDFLFEEPQPLKFKTETMRATSAVAAKRMIDGALSVTEEGGKKDKRIVSENLMMILSYLVDDLKRSGYEIDVESINT